MHGCDAGSFQLVARDRGEIEVALPRAGAGDPGELGVHLLADLVAAAARAGADRGGDRAGRAELAQRGDALGDDPGRERAPAAVQRRDRDVGRQQDREAVGDEHERGGVLERGRLPVLLVHGPVERGRAMDGRAVHLLAEQEPLARQADRRGEPLAVGVDVRGVVVGQAAEVERCVRAGGDAATAAGEQHAAAGEVGGDVVALPAEGSGQRHHDTAGPRPGHRGRLHDRRRRLAVRDERSISSSRCRTSRTWSAHDEAVVPGHAVALRDLGRALGQLGHLRDHARGRAGCGGSRSAS